MRMLRILAVGYIAMGVTQILSGVMRGAGDTMTPMWISLVTTVVVRVPIAYGLEFLTRPEGGAMGSGTPDPLFLSLLISWLAGAVITAIAYRKGRWRKKSIIAVPAGQGSGKALCQRKAGIRKGKVGAGHTGSPLRNSVVKAGS